MFERTVRPVAVVLLGLLLDVTRAQAQRQVPHDPVPSGKVIEIETRWRISGDVGGVLGSTWLAGPSSPTVSSGAGVALSLGANRPASRHIDVGGSVRLFAQSLHLRDGDTRWDGGSLTEADALATMAIVFRRDREVHANVEVGGGLAFLSGPSALYPFSVAARVTPSADFGLSIQRTSRGDGHARSRTLALFARYGVVRVDPGPTPVSSIDEMMATPGWVGRTMVGIRVLR